MKSVARVTEEGSLGGHGTMQAAIHVKKGRGGIAEWTKKTPFGESMNVATPAQPHTGTVRSGMRGQKMDFFRHIMTGLL